MSLADGNISIKLSDLTPDWLQKNYLPGFSFVDLCNKPYPESFFETHLQNAVAKLEKLCDICILTREIRNEVHDYHIQDYMNWGWLGLYQVPVQRVLKFRGMYPLSTRGVEYPNEWINIRGDSGQITIVANHGSLASLTIGQGGMFLPILYNQGAGHIPDLWYVDYVAGMDPENLPRPIVEAIAKLACMDILSIFSDLTRPIGISSESASIDGLSQSTSYTVPAFQGRLTRYESDLYGPPGKSQELSMTSGLLKQIRDFYRPINMESL